MEATVKLPVGLRNLPQFRLLKDLLGDASRAVACWYVLFEELTYRMQDGGAPGRVSRAEAALFGKAFEGLFETGDVFKLLEESRVLRADGDEFVCLTFLRTLNGVGQAARGASQRGGDVKAFNANQRRLAEEAMQLSLAIGGGKMQDADGTPLTPEECNRVTRLIISCDNALFKPPRPSVAVDVGLIQSALAVTRKYSDEQINHILTVIAKNRESVVLAGVITERLLPMFGDMPSKLGQ